MEYWTKYIKQAIQDVKKMPEDIYNSILFVSFPCLVHSIELSDYRIHRILRLMDSLRQIELLNIRHIHQK